MSTVYLKRSDPTVDRLIRATFPDFTGKSVEAKITNSVRFYGTMWDEGYKRDYMLVRLTDLAIEHVPEEQFMQRSEDHHKDVELPPGMVVVVWCRGRYEHIEIHSCAENVQKLLPAPVELTEDERIVLIATRSLKSSYAGIKDFRFYRAREKRGITRERYDIAKQSLITKKLLNKAGAITVDGQNATNVWDSL